MGIIIIIFPTWELSLPHILLVPPSVRGCILSQLAQSRMYKDHKPKKLTFGWMLISGKKNVNVQQFEISINKFIHLVSIHCFIQD